jgi:hypothetical protein
MKTKTFEFKTHEQMQEFLQALDEVNEDDLIDYVTSTTEHGYAVNVIFNKYTNELDEYIINNIALKILTKI